MSMLLFIIVISAAAAPQLLHEGHVPAGYAVFRWTNFQKDTVRSSDGNCLIWGSKPRVIRATYVPVRAPPRAARC